MNALVPFIRPTRRFPINAFLPAMLLLVASSVCLGGPQQSSIQSAAGKMQVGRDDDDSIDSQTSPAAEMLAKRRIKLEEKEHQETVERATEASKLGSELVESYQKTQKLAHQDFKKLDRIEKLARKIRDAFGGSGQEIEIENAPHDISSALQKLRDLSSDLQDRIGKTSRMEISAAVIERTNELIEVIKMLRSMRTTNA